MRHMWERHRLRKPLCLESRNPGRPQTESNVLLNRLELKSRAGKQDLDDRILQLCGGTLIHSTTQPSVTYPVSPRTHGKTKVQTLSPRCVTPIPSPGSPDKSLWGRHISRRRHCESGNIREREIEKFRDCTWLRALWPGRQQT